VKKRYRKAKLLIFQRSTRTLINTGFYSQNLFTLQSSYGQFPCVREDYYRNVMHYSVYRALSIECDV